MLRPLSLVCAFFLVCACGSSPSSTSALQGSKKDRAGQSDSFPTMPNDQMTPGKLCQHADTYRYPEHVAYCERDVSSETKREIIHQYDEQFGYSIGSMNRADFKIDHLIPLCAGGANDADNLWPQHRSVYEQTDPLEPLLCQLMAEGKMLQSEAVEIVIDAKHHLPEVSAVVWKLQGRLTQK